MEVVAPLRLYGIRHLSHEAENDGYVMRRKRPQDIFFTADFAKIETVRIDVLDPAQLTFFNQFF